MTKILLSVLLCWSFSYEALACRPAPLTRTECSKPNVQVNYKDYIRLLKGMKKYQKILSAGIVYPQHSHSCFNNQFADFYGMEFKQFMDSHHRLVCQGQLDVVKGSFQHLIGTNTEEFRAVKHSSTQQELKDLAAKLRLQIEKVLIDDVK